MPAAGVAGAVVAAGAAGAVVAVIIIGSVLFAIIRMGGSAINRMSTNRGRTSSITKLEKIAEALNAYANDNKGFYPPRVTRDAKGATLHSWRVLILPYLGEEELYNQFDLSLPWDHQTNMSLANEIPSVYQHPRASEHGLFLESGYYVVYGRGTLFPNNAPLGPNEFVDDPKQTVLVIEGMPLVSSAMWIEPIDMDFSKITGSIGTNQGIEPGGLLEDGAAMVTVDGKGHFLEDTMDPRTVRALLTPNGGERIRDDVFD